MVGNVWKCVGHLNVQLSCNIFPVFKISYVPSRVHMIHGHMVYWVHVSYQEMSPLWPHIRKLEMLGTCQYSKKYVYCHMALQEIWNVGCMLV